ncbi:DUF6415 family natural product biosynthesis protein [Streptomyces anulatus]|uniref:DUF6415 family natural product biosynthesis protein n=1 Tax=Streptomyces anulatus TaxID=1892 RepID=UPI0033CA0929|nr:DUF6415 family natural product biosynthesis protein [Streptomyces anulatus]
MRLPLTSRRDACTRGAQSRQGGIDAEPGRQRDRAAAAAETVALVLDEDSPLPESVGDVEELVLRLRGHIGQLGAVVPPGDSVLHSAQQLASVSVPDGHLPGRVHLVQLAEATQRLIATAQTHGVAPAKTMGRRRWWKPQLNVLRGSVFALAIACFVLAASVPRT